MIYFGSWIFFVLLWWCWSSKEFSVSLSKVIFVCSLVPRNASCMEAVSCRASYPRHCCQEKSDSRAGWLLRISTVNSHPWKKEPNPLPARISASLCNPVPQGGKRGNYSRHSGQGMPKGTPLVARQGYQNQDWDTRKAKADSFQSALLRVSPSCTTS